MMRELLCMIGILRPKFLKMNTTFFLNEKLSLYRQHSSNVLGESNKSFIKSFSDFLNLEIKFSTIIICYLKKNY